MISSWRRRKSGLGHRARKKELPTDDGAASLELVIPTHFRCPISLDLMKDPVTLSTGITYDRDSIEEWIEAGHQTCPITKQELKTLEPIPNHTIRRMIQNWCVENRSHGFDRIPTPRIPVTEAEVSDLISKLTVANRLEDRAGCQELVAKVKAIGRESERNKRRIVAGGAGRVLTASFQTFSNCGGFDKNAAVLLEETLSVLTWMLPLDRESNTHLESTASLRCIVWFLKSNGDLSARRNAALVLKSVMSSDRLRPVSLQAIEGAPEALVKLIKEPISPATTKASLVVMYHMLSSPSSSPTTDQIVAKFAAMGLVRLLLELLVDSDRSVCEKGLGVLDGICDFAIGREEASDHDLTIPLLVKKILRVSNLATEFSVSILWKLIKSTGDDGGVVVEALRVGAFQKLLLVLQVGCGEKTKEKATELLKLLNSYRDRLECTDSMDFKNLKRPF